MYIAHRWSDRNLTRGELIVSLTMIAVLISVFSTYALRVFAVAERSAVYITISNINTALKFQANYAAYRNDWESLYKLESMNPMVFVTNIIGNSENAESEYIDNKSLETVSFNNRYIGEFNFATPELMDKGKWYFDKQNKELVYLVKNTEFFTADVDGVPRISFSINIEYDDVDGNGLFDGIVDRFKSIKLVPKYQYHWDL